MERILFKKSEQRKFINKVKGKNSLKMFLDKNKYSLGIPYSTLKNYYAEGLLLPANLFHELCRIGKTKPNQYEITYLPQNWGQIKGGKIGIKTLQKKIKDGTIIKNKKIKIKKMNKYRIDKKMAELIGIYLGDGTLAKYFVRISGDRRYDEDYFKYISKLVKEVVQVNPSIRYDKRIEKNLIYIEFWSKKFCDFLVNELGLKYGDKIKNQVKIPQVIASKNTLLRACLRGLVDTDGFVGRDGKTFSIRFGAHNISLLDQVETLGKNMGFFTFRTKKETGTRNWKLIKMYFEVVGSSNLRHIVRFCEYLQDNPIKKEDVLKYYEKYKYVNLPFKFKIGPIV